MKMPGYLIQSLISNADCPAKLYTLWMQFPLEEYRQKIENKIEHLQCLPTSK